MATLVNRAKVSTSTTGTGTITLGTAEGGYLSFADAGVSDGDTVRYVIEEGNNFEIGTGTYTASGTTLSRTPSESSKADNTAITLAGEAVVYIAATKDDFVNAVEGGTFAGNVDFSSGIDVTGNITVTGTVDGRDVATDGTKLDGIATSANNYSLPLSSSSTRGGVKIGYAENGKNYPVELSSEKMFVNVPWTDTDTNTTYSAGSGLSLSGTTFSHTDTSSQASVNNSGNTVIQDVTLDTYGHVTGLTSKALSIPAAANNATITLNAGAGLSGGGNFTTNQSSNETITINLEAPYTYIDTASGNYGTVKVDDDRGVTWAGYAIRDDWVLMSDGSSNVGIYNDTDNEWALMCRRNAEVEFYHNGTVKFETSANGIEMSGRIDMNNNDIYGCDQLFHHGDTNTYMQFHAADQWRVVTGGTERLEVNNTNTTVANNLIVSGNLTVNGTMPAASAANDIFWENGQTVSSNYTITNGKNAMSAGPITINSGVTVTVGDGETWTVV